MTASEIINTLLGMGIAGVVGNFSTDLVKLLWHKIRDRLKSDPDARNLIIQVEQNRSEKHLKMLIPCLEEAMKNKEFAAEISQLVQKIMDSDRGNINKNFTAKDNAAVVANATAQQQIFGGKHYHTHASEKK